MKKPTESRNVNTNECTWITPEQGMQYFQISRDGLMTLATQAGAVVSFGRRIRIHRKLVEDYLMNEYRFDYRLTRET